MEKIQGKRTKRFLIGVTIIVVSFALGWPVLSLTGTMAILYGRFWLILGGIIYAISWVILGIGFLIAGPDGIRFAKELFRKAFKRCVR